MVERVTQELARSKIDVGERVLGSLTGVVG